MSVGATVALSLVFVPTAGALLCRFYSDDLDGWTVAAVALSVTTILAAVFAALLVTTGVTEYRIRTGVALTLRSDALSVTIGLLDALLTLGILVYTRTAGPRGARFYEAYLFFTASVFAIVLTADLVVIYLALLLLIRSTGRLIESGEKSRTTEAASAYRRTASAGATVYLLGVLTAVGAAWADGDEPVARSLAGGPVDGATLGTAVDAVGYDEPAIVLSFVLTTVGLAALVALLPLHGWLVDTHANSPDPVSALISGVLPAAAVYALARVLFDVYTPAFFAANPTVATGILYGALASLLLGNVLAYAQRDIKGLLAYSTVSQFGLVVAGLLVGTETAVFGAIIQLFGHGVVKGALCLLAGIVAIRFDARTIDEYAGLARRAPILAASFAALGIAMIGLPPTVGFVGKWYVAVGALEEGLWIVAVVVLVSTLLTLGYVLPFIDRIYFGAFEGADSGTDGITGGMITVVVLAAIVALVIGIASVSLESFLGEAIEELLTETGQ